MKSEDYASLQNMGFNLPYDGSVARDFARTFPTSDAHRLHYTYLPIKIKDPAENSLHFWHRTGLTGDFQKHDKHMKFWGIDGRHPNRCRTSSLPISALAALENATPMLDDQKATPLDTEVNKEPVTFSTGVHIAMILA